MKLIVYFIILGVVTNELQDWQDDFHSIMHLYIRDVLVGHRLRDAKIHNFLLRIQNLKSISNPKPLQKTAWKINLWLSKLNETELSYSNENWN